MLLDPCPSCGKAHAAMRSCEPVRRLDASVIAPPPQANAPMRWGMQVPPGKDVLRAWGARAIYAAHLGSGGRLVVSHVDIVGDRQDFFCASEGTEDHDDMDLSRHTDALEHGNFIQWAQRAARRQLADVCEQVGLGVGDELKVGYDEGNRHMVANPFKSFGYLFIVAWEERA